MRGGAKQEGARLEVREGGCRRIKVRNDGEVRKGEKGRLKGGQWSPIRGVEAGSPVLGPT